MKDVATPRLQKAEYMREYRLRALRGETGQPCKIEGCASSRVSYGYCETHWGFVRHHGTPERMSATPKGEGDSWDVIHMQLRRKRGQPSLCHHCWTTEPGLYQWALDRRRAGSSVRFDPKRRMEYSMDMDAYIRLCRSCHGRFDRKRGVA